MLVLFCFDPSLEACTFAMIFICLPVDVCAFARNSNSQKVLNHLRYHGNYFSIHFGGLKVVLIFAHLQIYNLLASCPDAATFHL